VITAAAAVLTGLVVALWQVGGRGALARRTIKQELEIASGLPEGPERLGLEAQARDRAALYVHRRRSVGPSPTARLRLVACTLLAFPLAALLWFLASIVGSADGPNWLLGFFFMSGSAVFVAWGGLLGYWLSLGIRLWRARIRRGNVAEAHAALDPARDDDA
jgi:hypothetical protein